jgi:osmotically inducible protein OsmC
MSCSSLNYLQRTVRPWTAHEYNTIVSSCAHEEAAVIACTPMSASSGVAHMIRRAKAVWQGTGRAGHGNLSTDSGVLAQTPYSFRTRFENEKGTNPEELIGAAHAGCFTMALAFRLQAAGHAASELTTEAAITLEQDGAGVRITRSALTLRGSVPSLDQDTFAKLAQEAEQNCPVSKLLKAEITLDAKLI